MLSDHLLIICSSSAHHLLSCHHLSLFHYWTKVSELCAMDKRAAVSIAWPGRFLCPQHHTGRLVSNQVDSSKFGIVVCTNDLPMMVS